MTALISIDLADAARRSESFPKDWSDEQLHAAIARYERFLLLAAAHRGVSLAPTRDIDEVWHLHMLRPKAYHEDCLRLLGYLLDHDGGFGKEPEELPLLQRAFSRTAEMWQEAYGEPYTAEVAEDGVNCWHNCQSRCWHACKSNIAAAS